MSRPRLLGALAAVLFLPILVCAAEPRPFAEAKHGKGELSYVNGVPVVQVEGKPAEIGDQMAVLTAKSAEKLLGYPKDYLKSMKMEFSWPLIVKMAQGMAAQFPADYMSELETGIKVAHLNRELVIAANAMFDIKRMMGCSALMVEPERSATKQMIFGRNLDFPTLGYLHEYSIVSVVRPEGKHAFASVGLPGLTGVLSGMNDAGLTLAVLECYPAVKDDSPKFDAKGVPYAMCFRRLLEECTTVDEAEKLLKTMKRTTRVNLAICDKTTAAVFEITSKTVVVRRAENGVCPCTNHFRTPDLATDTKCWRYSILEKCQDKDAGNLDVAAVAKKMDEVSQTTGDQTLQTMVFEPATLTLHVALGKPPASKLPLKTIELGPLFSKKAAD
jgi:predicted choloylglycine hydrolase